MNNRIIKQINQNRMEDPQSVVNGDEGRKDE